MVGPSSPRLSGLSVSRTSAVMTLVTLAAGIACSLPELAIRPSPDTPTAAAPRSGQGLEGGVPFTTCVAGRAELAVTAGTGRRQLTAAAAASSSTSAIPTRTRIAEYL